MCTHTNRQSHRCMYNSHKTPIGKVIPLFPINRLQNLKMWAINCPKKWELITSRAMTQIQESSSPSCYVWSFPGGSDGKASVCLQGGRPRFDSWVRKISWRRKWQPTPVLLPGKFHRLRSLEAVQSMGSQRVGTRLSYFTFTLCQFLHL